MIITRSYFKGEIAISNAEDKAPNSNLLGNGLSLDQFIARYERDIMTRILGYDLYKLFSDQFDKSLSTGLWTLKDSADAKWNELLNGKEYILNGVNVKWEGLVFKDGTVNNGIDQSLIAYYVYTKFIEATEFTHSGVGMQSELSKNSVRVDARSKIADAFNSFYGLAIGNSSYYNNYQYFDSYFNNSGYKSLYDFIGDMNGLDSATYPNWCPTTQFKLENRYGL